MAYHDELLQQAFDLVDRVPANPKQADLRRGVSAAYYAVFHLLISETITHWSLDSSRNALGRMFEHSVMKRVSMKVSDSKLSSLTGETPSAAESLRGVANAFSQLQDKRKIADYVRQRDARRQEFLSQNPARGRSSIAEPPPEN